jgi:cyanophycin synthetase
VLDAIPARRRLIVLGQAGDRGDDALRDLAGAAWALGPERVILKELATLRRGRPAGELRRVLREELLRLGTRPEMLEDAETEPDAARAALAWARPGDLVVLLVHEARQDVLALLAEAGAR